MKKLLTIAFVSVFALSSIGQEAADKEFLAGIVLGGSMNFNSSQTNTMKSKVGGDFIVGMAIDWSFSKNFGLSSGLEFDFNSFKTSYDDGSFIFDYDDKNILRKQDVQNDNESYAPYNHFLLTERKHNNIFLSVPVMLKFQSNYMGYMRYYGKFGVRNSFLLSTRTNNKGVGYNEAFVPSDIAELDKMKSKGVLNFYKGSIGIAGGAEYNITGTTVLVAELGYYYGFTEAFQQRALFKDDERFHSLYEVDADGNREYYTPKMKQGQLILKVSVLF